MAEVATTVDVGASLSLIDTDPSAHTDANSSAFMKLPSFDPASGLSSIINNSTGGTAADANGFFHPLGDHAQVSFIIDGQPISDQQSKVFSTQLPPNAIQSMELITGAPDAQYGDKSSLVVNATTKSGLGAQSIRKHRSRLGVVRNLRRECHVWLGLRPSSGISSRSMAFAPAISWTRRSSCRSTTSATTKTFSIEWIISPNGRDAFHLNLFLARNWFQVPNSYDQLSQDQKQRVLTWNVAPGYQHTFGSQHVAHDQSVRAPRSSELLRQPRSVR